MRIGRCGGIVLIASLLAGAGTSVLAHSGGDSQPRRKALLIVGGKVLGASDRALGNRLARLGYEVSLQRGVTSTDDAKGKAVVVISSSASPQEGLERLRTARVPLLVAQPQAFGALGLTWDQEGYSGQSVGDAVLIADLGHPIVVASGLSGRVVVAAPGSMLGWGIPGGNARFLATLAENASNATLFAYDEDEEMVDLSAPARRVGAFVGDATVLTADGWRFFDASVRWLVDGASDGDSEHEKACYPRARPTPRATPRPTARPVHCVPFWGPRKYVRTHGAPDVYTATIEGLSAASPFTLRVQNGESDGDRRVSSATIVINGEVVARPSDFNHNVAGLKRSVVLTPTTSLEVRLASRPGSFLILGFCGAPAPTARPTPTATSSPTPTPTSTPVLTPPLVDAGVDQTLILPQDQTLLTGSATDDQAVLTYQWTQVSGPAAVIHSPLSPSTAVTVTTAGTYVFRLSVSDGAATGTDDVVITALENAPPTIEIGPSQVVFLPATQTTLTATTSDDGLPSELILEQWTQVNGPAPATFSDPNSTSTVVTLPALGIYLFQLAASDGALTTTAQVQVDYRAP
jgi:hypothetical protein